MIAFWQGFTLALIIAIMMVSLAPPKVIVKEIPVAKKYKDRQNKKRRILYYLSKKGLTDLADAVKKALKGKNL